MKRRKLNLKNKKGLEMAFGTIVTMVLAVVLLVLGIVFVKRVMCTGLILVEGVDTNVQNELNKMFEQNEYGVKCMGDPGTSDKKFGGGGSRDITCVINTDSGGEYVFSGFDVTKIGTAGASEDTIKNTWLTYTRDSAEVSSGKTTVRVAIFTLPRDIVATDFILEFEVYDSQNNQRESKALKLSVAPQGFVTSALC